MEMVNKNIVITGGASGIGLAFAIKLSIENTVFICDVKKRSLFKVKKNYPKIQGFECDITSDEKVAAFVAFIEEKVGHVDVLINNAAIGYYHDLTALEFKTSDIIPEVEVNFIGQVRVTHHFLPLLKKKGSSAIITISAGLAIVPYYKSCIYSATKAALHSYIQSLRKQLEKESIKIIEIFPPFIDTLMSNDQEEVMSVDDFVHEVVEALTTGQEEIFVGVSKSIYEEYRKNPAIAYARVQQMEMLKKDSMSTLRKMLEA